MKFSSIFDVFSRRNEAVDPFVYTIPPTFRNKVFLFCREVFSNSRSGFGGNDYTREFWEEIHQVLQYRHGRLTLVEGAVFSSRAEDAIKFLTTCKDNEFLDFIEYIFRVNCLFHISMEENTIVAELNELLASESLGYVVTEMVKEEVIELVAGPPFNGRPQRVIKTVSYPIIIRKDNQVTHANIVKPALQLLTEPKYKSANDEYLKALDDYRKGDFGDCLTKCCSAFESVMKVLCDSKGWPYKQIDTASTLIRIIIQNTHLDAFFEQPLVLVATLRNKLSTSHGAGTQIRAVSQNLARFALNATASAIILLINEAK